MRIDQHAARRAETGFSLIEALIATGILLMIAIGIIPLFASSILNNSRGSDSTTETNHARSQMEDLLQLPWGGAILTLPATGTTSEIDEWWAPGDTGMLNDSAEGWQAALPTGFVPWTRKTLITQYNISALDDGFLGTNEVEDGSTPPLSVQLKMIQVEVDSGKQGFGSGEKIVLQAIKAY